MKRMKKYIVLGLLSAAMHTVSAQVLLLEDALRTALANNQSVIIARNEQEAAKYSRHIGNAGMLPVITASGGATFSSININQNLSNGNNIDQSGVRSDNYTATAQLSWVLFDGLKMFATYDRLTELKKQSEAATRVAMENAISGVITAYFDVVKNQQILRSLQESVAVSEERLRIARKRLEVGSGSKTEVLQAEIDRNSFLSQVYTQEAAVYTSKTTLNRLLARPVDTEFEVTDSIPSASVKELDGLRRDAITQNNTLLIRERDIAIQKFTRREINAGRFPKITFNSSYTFNRAQNQAGLFLLNQNYGYYGGFTASITLFDGWKLNTQYHNATLMLKNAGLQWESTQQETDAALLRAYRQYETAQKMSALEEESMRLARENMDLSLERFKQGLDNSLVVREAQKSFVEAVTRYMNARYAAKIQEVELLRLSGGLVK